MQFHCVIYFDPQIVFGGSAEAQSVLADTGPHAAALAASGKLVASYPLNMPTTARTIAVRDGQTVVSDGPFLETKEMVGGLVVIEASDLNEAISIAAGIPHARLGHVEIRPAIDFSQPRPRV